MKKLKSILSIFSISIFLSGCNNWINRGDSINIVGSSALQPLVETIAETFQTKNFGKFINVQGGGSGTGLSQVQSGAVDIGNSDLFAEEKNGINAGKLIDHKVAVVGIVPVVNKSVGLKEISMNNLRKIFLGEIKNWKEIGGKNLPVVILNRAVGSGTRKTFEKWVLTRNSITTQEQDSSGMVRQIVADTPGAISYLTFSYVTNEVEKLSIDGIKPTDKNVMNNKWKIWSYEHMYTKNNPKDLTKEFLEYILSDEVQKNILTSLGYIPISQMKVEKDSNGNLID